MKLESFGISNFKAFGQDIQRMPLKPITLIFGPNSAGKSSLLQSFLWSLDSSASGNLESRRTKAASGSVDLGGFRSMLHRHDAERRVQVEVAIDMEVGPEPLRIIHQLGIPGRDDLRRMQKVLISESPITETYLEQLKICSDSRQKFSELFNYQGLPSQEQLEALLQDPDALEEHIARIVEEMTEQGYLPFEGRPPDQAKLKRALKDGAEAWKRIQEMKPRMAEIETHCAHVDRVIEQEGMSAGLLAIDVVYRGETLLKAIRQPGCKILDCQVLVDSAVEELPDPPKAWQESMGIAATRRRNGRCLYDGYEISVPNTPEFEVLGDDVVAKALGWIRTSQEIARTANSNLVYLGPLRHLPARKELLGLLGEQSADSAILPWLRIRDEPELRAAVNRALQQLQSQPCEFSSKVYATGREVTEAKDEFGSFGWSRTSFEEPLWLDAQTEGFGSLPENPHFDSLLSDDEMEAYQKLDDKLTEKFGTSVLVDLGIRDLRHGVTVSLRDVGVGISQIAPILVHAHANQEKLIAIEQPEIHIHPALQAELADVFIESALGVNKNSFLLETHSEHLILRILRRIRETARNTLPDGCLPIRPEDVAVLYVQPGEKDEEGAVVRELRVNEQGRFVDEWPNGFFEERFNEEF